MSVSCFAQFNFEAFSDIPPIFEILLRAYGAQQIDLRLRTGTSVSSIYSFSDSASIVNSKILPFVYNFHRFLARFLAIIYPPEGGLEKVRNSRSSNPNSCRFNSDIA